MIEFYTLVLFGWKVGDILFNYLGKQYKESARHTIYTLLLIPIIGRVLGWF